MNHNAFFFHSGWMRQATLSKTFHIFRLFVILVYLLSLVGAPTQSVQAATPITFTAEELLGKPTDTSVAVKIVPAATIEYHYQYGLAPGDYTGSTPNVTATGAQPSETAIDGLAANTRYYYRMQYHAPGQAMDDWVNRPEGTFWTQRAPGSTFTFTITSDSHIDIQLGNSGNWTNTLNDIARDNADFNIDLGDTVAMDNGSSSIAIGDDEAAEQAYLDSLQYFNIISGSSPIFLLPGNHEQQEGWHRLAPLAGSLPVMSKNAEKNYFLNPIPNSFYDGDTGTYEYLDGDQLRQAYYAWTWGDALFVVINPYWFSTTKPYTTTVGGGETDTTGSGDRWDWTLGQEQFDWLQQTLAGSDARYKFVFSHQIVGSNGMTTPFNQVNYGHGGVDAANYAEWGGYNTDGTTWAWNTERSGWSSQPIRQMMEASGVTAFFHGHDHQYAYEMLNGMVYTSAPSGSFSGSFGNYTTGGNSGNTIWADSSQGPGHLRVTVSPAQTSVDFIRSGATTAAYTYTMAPTGGPSYNLTVDVDPSGAGSTTPAVGTYSYIEGSVVDVTASPAPGYQFDRWSGACSGSGACQVTMTEDLAVTAHFTETPPGALTYIGDIGGAISKTSGAGLTVTTTAAVAAGDDIMIVYVTDPSSSIPPISVTDAAGNTYNEVGLALNSGQLRTYLFAAFDVAPLPAGSNITITASASVTARAAVVSVFRGLDDIEVIDQISTGENDAATTASSGATATTAQADELLVGGIGTEGPQEDAAGTWQGSFVAGPRQGTTGGTADTNITAALGWRIVSEVGAYTASKTGMTSRDHASIIATFRAAPNPNSPRITVTGTPLSAFTSVPGVPSAEKSYQVSGSNLTNDITITAPSDFQISLTSGGVFGSSLTLPQTGGSVAETTVYVRFNRATNGTSSGDITHASSGATNRNVAVSGTATATDFDILLGRPTDESVTVNVIPNQDVDIYVEYGLVSGTYPNQTATYTATAGAPLEFVVDGLAANTRYFYRLASRLTGATTAWSSSDEYSFITQRATGSTFTFTIISDSHLGQYGGQTADELALYQQTLQNIGADQPDFHIDLGDTFAMDPSPLGTGMTEAEADAAYVIQRPYLGEIAHSIPVYLAIGNHENEEGWNFDDVFTAPDQSLARVGMKYRKLYYPVPVPDGFYTGNVDPLPEAIGGDTNHEDYYAWTWGDALFVVLDPYHYSMTWPNDENEGYGGEGQDDEASGDRWDWTLGIEQYLWFKQTLENSDAKYKFVFSHHVTGGSTPYGRGGIEAAPYFEWGGRNADGTWGWDVERPASEGWTVPVHQLMVDNGVDVYFHGHDHIFAYEELDGIVYLECPKPDDAGYAWEPYGYGYTEDLYPNADAIQNSGYIRVTVSPTSVEGDYVRSYLPGDGANGSVAYSFSVQPSTTTMYDLTTAVSPTGGGTITPSAGTYSYEEGTVVNVTATAASGFVFDSWSGACSGSGACSVTMNSDQTVTANFVPQTTYTITATAGANGTITPSGAVIVTAGNDQSFTITPATGYYVVDVLVDGGSVGAATSYTFNDVAANHTISATFAINTYTITAAAGANGAIVPAGATTVNWGEDQAYAIIPATNYHVEDVLVDGGSVGAMTSYTFENVTANHTISATFEADNVAPVAVNDTYSTPISTTLNVVAPGVLSNDTDANLDTLTAAKVSNPANGVLTLNADGSFTYTPTTGYTGDDTFTYRANDGSLNSNTATVTVRVGNSTPPVLPSSFYGTIQVINNPPTAGQIVEAYVPGATGPVATATINDATPLNFAMDVPGDSTGTPAKDGGVSGDTITFKINGRTVAAYAWVSGTNVRLDIHPPEAVAGGPYAGNEGASISFNASRNDLGGDAASYQWDWNNDGSYDAAGQSASYTWIDNGTPTVGLKVTDAQGGEGQTTFVVTVNDVLPASVNAGGPYSGSVGQSISLSGSAVCTAVDTCTYTWDLDDDGAYDDAVGATASYTWDAAGDYTVGLQVTDDDGNAVADAAAVQITTQTTEISLVAGWNLISFNLHPTDTAIDAVLASLAGNYDLVYAWNAADERWLKYAPGVGYGDSLTSLDETIGFWIRMTTADTLSITGAAPTTSNISLVTGWNLVSFPSATALSLPEAFSLNGVGEDFSLVYAYRAADSDVWKKYDRTATMGNDLDELIPGYAYWVLLTADHSWMIAY